MQSVRAQRLMDLYELRAKVVTEIGQIESAIQSEAAHAARVHDAFALGRRANEGNRAQCGTDSGYQLHVRYRKEPACLACKLAHAAYEQARRKRRLAS